MRSSALRSLALLDMYEGRYRDAKARLREAISLNAAEREPFREARNRLFLSIVLDGQGDAAGRLKELDRATEAMRALAAFPVWLAARVGAAYARAGATGEALRLARRVARNTDPNNPKDRSELHMLQGELALADGHLGRAVEVLQSADREARSPLTLAALARAHRAAGQTEPAIELCETLAGMGHLVLGWEPQQAWIAAHADLSECYLSRGEMHKAAKILAVAARLWEHADPDLPLVKRMARLRKRLPSNTQ
jgi:tetratricopeptide (TPR) repeat protein